MLAYLTLIIMLGFPVIVQSLSQSYERDDDKKKDRKQEYAEKRLELATKLMSEILGDHPSLPQQPALGQMSMRRMRSRDTSPVSAREATPKRQARPVGHRDTPHRSVTRQQHNYTYTRPAPVDAWNLDEDRTEVSAEEYMSLRDSHDIDAQKERAPEKMPTGNREEADKESKPYKPKPYTQIVRVQRPEITRNKQANIPQTYRERLSEMKSETPRTPNTPKSQQRLYGE